MTGGGPRKRKKKTTKKGVGRQPTLKDVAKHASLSPATISLVLNRAPAADAIPMETQERVIAAARELGYRPHYIARSLRSRKTNSIGVLVPEISDPYAAEIVSGIESYLLKQGYHYLVTSHRRSTPKLLQEDLELLTQRAVDGLILVATDLQEPPPLPAVVISGHTKLNGLANVVIDHDQAARIALTHLKELGHHRIALFKGQPESSDTDDRSRAILKAAASLGVEIPPNLILQLSGEDAGEVFAPDDAYREGYVFGQKLLSVSVDFTALFAFDDASAIGAIRAFHDAGLEVPADISVVGFDDIQYAEFHNPSLTTVRQPLREMGQTAARVLLQRLAGTDPGGEVWEVLEPKLMVRESTGPAKTKS